jgi:hypothetical protein
MIGAKKMAGNKTKLSQAASKSAFDFDDDLDDFFNDGPAKGGKSPIQQFMSGMKTGLLDKGKSKALLKSFITSGMPDGYVRGLGVLDQVKAGAGSLRDHLESTNPGDLQYLMSKADKMLGSMKGRMPESLHDKISSTLSDKVDKYKYQIEANRNPTMLAIRNQQQQNESDIKNALGEDLRGAIDQSTVVSRNLFNKSEQATQQRWDLDRIERGLRDQVSVKTRQGMLRELTAINTGIDRIVNYNEQINYDFQRKGLELQFRTYQEMRDMKRLAEASLEMNNKAFQALVRNTGLPDHLKSSMKDLLSMNVRQGMATGTLAFGGKTLSNFLGGYGNQVQNNVNQKASSTLAQLVQTARMGEGMGSLWDERYQLGGQLAAEGLHSFGRSTVAPILGRMARPHLDQLNQRYGGGRDKQAGYFADNIPAIMQDFVNNYQNSYGAKGVLQNVLRPFVPQFGLQTGTSAGNYQTIGQHTAFNQLSQRALTEILPGFQARILRELRMLRTGKENVPMEVYDITRGMFTNSSQAQSNLQDRIVSKSTARLVSGQINETLSTFDDEQKLSPAARRALSERLLRDASTNKHFDTDRYASSYGYKEGTSKETLNELKTFFNEKFEKDEHGKFKATPENFERRKKFSDAFLNIRNVSRDPGQEIQRLLQAGETTSLRELGIIQNVDGQDRINYPRLWEMMSTGVTDRSKEAGMRWQEYTGDTASNNFVGPHFPGQVSATLQNAFLNGAQGAKDTYNRHAENLQGKATQALDKVKELRDSAKAAIDGMDAGGLKAVLEGFSIKEKLDFVKALLENTLEKEPPQMREQRILMANQILASIEEGKVKGAAALQSGIDKATPHALRMLGYGEDKLDEVMANPEVQKLIGNVTTRAEAVRKLVDQGIVDLKLRGAQEPLIKAIDMVRGKLTDVNTGRIIQSAKDITGEVRNEFNQIVVTATEAAQGLYDERETLMTTARQKIDAVAAALGKMGGEFKAKGVKLTDDMKDWCLATSDEVVIKSRELMNGQYFDALTQEPIFSLDDIKGTIVDSTGRIVATAQELAQGLRSIDGVKFDIPGMKERAASFVTQLWRGNTTQNVIETMKLVGKGAWMLGRNTWARLTGDRDAYLPGEAKPVLTVEKLKEGMYLDEEGKPYTSFGDINGAVFDAETGEPILDKKELKQLVEVSGGKHKIAKNRGLLRRAVKGYWNLTKKYYSQLGSELGNDFKAGATMAGRTVTDPVGKFTKRQLANLSTTDQVLVQIRDAIRETIPKKMRKNSWMDMEEKDKSKGDETKPGDDNAINPKSPFGRLSAMFGGLMDRIRGKGKKGEEEEEESSITDKVQDGLSTAADLKDLSGNGKRGRLGRLGRRIGKSRIGQWGGKVAGSIGGRIAGTALAGYAVSGLTTAATAIAGLLSAPVLIGAGAVAAIGAAGYFGYKYFSSATGGFRNVRMLQYGITSTRERRKVLELEELFQKTSARGANPQLNINAENAKEMISIMGFDTEDPDELGRFARWIDTRFKPVYLQWLRALSTVGKMELPLNDIDDKMPDELKSTFVKEIVMPYGPGSVFDVRDDPDGSKDPLDDTTEDTKKAIAELAEKYKIDPDKKKDEQPLPGITPEQDANAAKATATVAGAATAATAAALADGKKRDAESQQAATEVTRRVNNMAKAAGVSVAATGAALVTVGPITTNELTALDSIRARAYGMETLSKVDMESLMSMETRYDLQSKVDQQNRVKFDGNMDAFIANAGSLFGMNTASPGPDRTRFVNWLLDRFMPVCESFLTTARVSYRGKPANASTNMKLDEQLRVANAIIGTVSPTGGSIWSVKSIFNVKGNLEELKDLAQTDLKHLEEMAATGVASPTQSEGAQAAGAMSASAGKGFFAGVADTVASAWSASTEAVKQTMGYAGSVASSAKSFVTNTASSIGSGVASAYQGAKDLFSGGASYGQVTKGNGGQWEQVPYPTSKNASGSIKSMQAIAQMTGVPVEYLMIFAAMESNFDWDAKAGTSSAGGWFQFINSTWDWMYQQNKSKYGLPPDTPQRSLKFDPRINGLLGAEYMKYSMGIIEKAIGRTPTDVELYLAHFLGPGTAAKWLSLPQSMIGAEVFPKQAAANRSVFYTASPPRARTLGEIMQSFDARMAKFRKIANVGTGDLLLAKPVTEEQAVNDAATAQAKADGESLKDTSQPTTPSAGPSATGSTPTNSGAGGAPGASPTQGGSMAQGPAPEASGSAPFVPSPSAGAGYTDAPAQDPSMAADSARDRQRAKEVDKQNTVNTGLMRVSQQQLDTQIEIRDLIQKILEAKQEGGQPGGANNSIAQQGRRGNNSPFPVSM